MNWDDMTEEQKRNYYDSWVQELKYEWGDNAKPVLFETLTKNGLDSFTRCFDG